MKPLSADTHPAIERILIEGYRAMPAERKCRIVWDLTATTRQLALARIRQQYPDASAREHALHLASLWIDRATMIRAFGWDPAEKGY